MLSSLACWGNRTLLAQEGPIGPGLCICGSAFGVIFPSFCSTSVPFSPGWQHFCWYKILKNLVSLP